MRSEDILLFLVIILVTHTCCTIGLTYEHWFPFHFGELERSENRCFAKKPRAEMFG